MPPWQIALSIMMAVVVMSLCLFPLAPYRLRITVVYFFLGLLGLIFALIAFRMVLFVFVFTLSGAGHPSMTSCTIAVAQVTMKHYKHHSRAFD
jgi:Na+/glutamate symporter